ncbi:hypothetical protein [Microbacterium sp. YJN-G]|uniref:hypothetical protein n=1 Tax=Microbacterium sp. YJN-G TaxID=2763257 RepID=UPI001878DC59|nr:hypothetical protein [Microbacterium sp. YJN-G]
MTRQLITLIGALITVTVVALGVMLGVLPLVGRGLTALDQTDQARNTNAVYSSQIDALEEQKQRMPQIEAELAALRTQIPAAPLVDQVFAIIDASASAAGVRIDSITRGELAAFAPRPEPERAGLVMAQYDPSAAPAAGADAAGGDPAVTGEAQADAVATDADAASGAAPAAPADAATPADPAAADSAAGAAAATDRQQVPITVSAKAYTMEAVQAFLDGLRGDARLLAVDKVTVTEGTDGFGIQLEALTFMRTDGRL